MIEEKIVSIPKDDLLLVWGFGPKDECHGRYGYRKYHMHTGEIEACTEEEENEYLRKAYSRIPPKVRNQVKYWSSFEKFKEQYTCYCEGAHSEVESKINWERLDEKALRAMVSNFIIAMKMEIYTLIRKGEIEESEDVKKILSLFD